MRPSRIFQSLSENIGRFDLKDKIFLIPEMNRIGSNLLAGTFRGFGINAVIMDTYRGLDLGKEFTSGKECYPCQVTMGDILYFMNLEKARLGKYFNPENYVYFMPHAGGPCRFGMYNKYQRIVLDTIPGLKDLKIGSLSTDDSYSLEGMLEDGKSRDFRKVGFLSVIVGDILDRLLWRIRPYEREKGAADEFIEKAMRNMAGAFEKYGAANGYDKILNELDEIIIEGKEIIDRDIPPKPIIGIVGEIYLRTHVKSNQDLIRSLERHGAEVVNASIAEWLNFIAYERFREARTGLRYNLRQLRLKDLINNLKKFIRHGGELWYQQSKQEKVYNRVGSIIDLREDHRVGHLEDILKEDDLFNFDIGTETCLSISAIMEYVHAGYNGVVNVYPFTCMPSTMTSAIIKPVLNRKRVPYLDASYDGTFQPNREAAIRTFMYQAHQHFERNGGRKESQA
ncbi:MAG: CoA activase [Deltaproteobacteria bacterium]|nr:CoA activase [Deltaproteobacteria bacterium]